MTTLRKVYDIASFKALDESKGTFEAIVSVFGNVDLQGDRVMPGAFSKTIENWRAKGDPVPAVWSHDWANPWAHVGFANPDDIEEITPGQKSDTPSGGLLVRGRLDVDKPFAAQVYDLLKERRVTNWSFAYDIQKEKIGADRANELHQLDLIEFGPCLAGANPATDTLGVKARLEKAAEIETQAKIDAAALLEAMSAIDHQVSPTHAAALGFAPKSASEKVTYRIESRIPPYDGNYSLERPEKFAVINRKTGEVASGYFDNEIEAQVAMAELVSPPKTTVTEETVDHLHLTVDHEMQSDDFSEKGAEYTHDHIDHTSLEHAHNDKAQQEESTADPDDDAALDDSDTVDADAPAKEETADETKDETEVEVKEADADGEKEVDDSAWDGPAAMSAAGNSEDPAAAFRAIAFERDNDSDPDTAAHWALPHHKKPGAAPNANGVSSALGALNGARGGKPDLKNEGAARSHLEAHESAIQNASEDSGDGKAVLEVEVVVSDGIKTGRVIGAKAAAALKSSIGEAVDAFVAEVNGASSGEGSKEVDGREEKEVDDLLAKYKEQLDALEA